MKAAAVPTVFVIDDYGGMRQAIQDLVESVGLRVGAFATGEEFLKRPRTAETSCLYLDVRLPQLSGLGHAQQAHRCEERSQRSDSKNPPRPPHGEDASRFPDRTRSYGRQARPLAQIVTESIPLESYSGTTKVVVCSTQAVLRQHRESGTIRRWH